MVSVNSEPPSATPGRARALPPSLPARWRWWVHLLLIGGYFVPGIVLASRHARQHPALTGTVRGLLYVSATQLLVFAIVFALGCAFSQPTREQLFLRWRPGWAAVPIGLGYSIAMRIALALVTIFVVAILVLTRVVRMETIQAFKPLKHMDVEKLVDRQALGAYSAYFWLALTLVSFVIGGLREELWRAGTLAALRELWPRRFATRGGELLAIALLAVVFGAAHLELGVIGMSLAGLLGIFLGVILLVHRSIWPAVFAHGFFDAASLALIPYALDTLQQLH